MRVGERTVNLQRLIAIKRGFKPEDEFDIPGRLLEAPRVGAAAGMTIKPHLKGMVQEYYAIMGFVLLAVVLFARISYAEVRPECSVHLDEGKRILASAGGKRTWK